MAHRHLDGATPPPAREADGIAALHHALEQAGSEPLLRERLAAADVTVWVEAQDVPGAGLGLSLREGQVDALDELPSPDVELRLDDGILAATMRGETSLALAIVSGQVSYDGPVRRFLRVLPILRNVGAEAPRRAAA